MLIRSAVHMISFIPYLCPGQCNASSAILSQFFDPKLTDEAILNPATKIKKLFRDNWQIHIDNLYDFIFLQEVQVQFKDM